MELLGFVFMMGLVLATAAMFGGRVLASDNPGFSVRGAALALALVPTLLSMVAALQFALTSWLMPGGIAYLLAPALIAIGAQVWLWRNGGATKGDDRLNRVWLLGLLAFVPFLAAVVSQVMLLQTDHDISVYLNEAAFFSQAMRGGLDGPLAWATLHHPVVVHPHSSTFSFYLALGFLTTANPGFGSDLVPRALVGLNHLCLVAAAFGVGAGVGKGARQSFIHGLVAATLVLCAPVWAYEIRAFSRDTFYLAPLLVLISLLLEAQPSKAGAARNIPRDVAVLMAVAGACLGHSLGIVYAGAVFGAIGATKLYEHRRAVLRIAELWVAVAALAAAGVYNVAKYLGNRAGELGFAYPYMNDPALVDAVNAKRKYVASPGSGEFLTTLFDSQDMGVALVALILTGVGYVLWQSRSSEVTPAGRRLLTLCAVLASSLLLIYAFPAKLDGISLASAFMFNFRYGFGIAILIMLAAAFAVVVLHPLMTQVTEKAMAVARIPGWVPAAGTVWALAVLVAAAWSSDRLLRNGKDSAAVAVEAKVCDGLKGQAARLIYLDNDGLLYRCGVRGAYLFTEAGARIIGGTGDADFQRLLDGQEVDAIVFTRNYWDNTRLHRYLERNWQLQRVGSLRVFVRPAPRGR